MTWTPLPLSPADAGAVLANVSRNRLTLTLTSPAIRAIGVDTTNVAISLGSGEHADWLRITADDDGISGEPGGEGRLVLTLARSTLPSLITMRNGPLTWRAHEGGLEIRLPTAAVPANVAVNGVARRQAAGPTLAVDNVTTIAPPDLYKQLHKDAWAAGLEMAWLSDGTVAVGGKVIAMDDVESHVRGRLESASSARANAHSRAGM